MHMKDVKDHTSPYMMESFGPTPLGTASKTFAAGRISGAPTTWLVLPFNESVWILVGLYSLDRS